jgi:hypothetical protein
MVPARRLPALVPGGHEIERGPNGSVENFTRGILGLREFVRNGLCSWHVRMRVLEARFHPWRKARGPFVVVGRVFCRRRRTVVEPLATGTEETTAARQQTMLQKLEYLVARSGRDTFRRLLDLRSDFWSFEEIQEEGPG